MLFRFWVFPDCTFLDISNSGLFKVDVSQAVEEIAVFNHSKK